MYIWGRLGWMMARARSRGPARFDQPTRNRFRCHIGDVDNYGHMNNARYPMLADIGRIELFIRTGMWNLARERNWWPMMGGVQSTFIREIRLWRRFDVISSLETWEDRQLLGLHRFVFEDGTTAAIVRTSIGVYDYTNRTFRQIDEIARALGVSERPRAPDEGEAAFLASQASLRDMAKQSPLPKRGGAV
ncbi:MAG: thioesterase family protein [Mesorhizobium sp.]